MNVFKLLVAVSIDVSLLFWVVLVVSLELVYEFKLLVAVSIADTLVNALAVNVLILPDAVSNDVNLPLALDVKVFNEAVVDSIDSTLVRALAVNVLMELEKLLSDPVLVSIEPNLLF